MNHFDAIVKRLSRDDLLIMNILLSKDSINKFQSLDKSQITTESGIGEYALRKVIERLELLMFIEVTKLNRFHHFYLTDYGVMAIQKITEGVEV
jgi:predicted transcriptional regulator